MKIATMPRSTLLLTLLTAMSVAEGCRAVEGIFKAGVWVGVVIAVIIIGVVIAIVRALGS